MNDHIVPAFGLHPGQGRGLTLWMWTRRGRPSRRPSCSNGGWRPSRVPEVGQPIGCRSSRHEVAHGARSACRFARYRRKGDEDGSRRGRRFLDPGGTSILAHTRWSWGTKWGTESRKSNRIKRLRSRACRLPSRSCEFDSRRPLQTIFDYNNPSRVGLPRSMSLPSASRCSKSGAVLIGDSATPCSSSASSI